MNEINKHSGSFVGLKDIANGVMIDLISTLIKNLVKKFASKVKKIFSAGGKDNKKELERKISLEFEELFMKIKFMAFGIMGNVKWDKIKPLEFRNSEDDKQTALLVFEVEKKLCWIAYEITEKDKQEFLKTSTFKILENFIIQRLVNYGKNGYFDYHCPDCKQTTLTRKSIINSPGEEAIGCNLCGWTMSMKVYQEYLEEKKYNLSLGFYRWLRERNIRMARMRNRRRGFI